MPVRLICHQCKTIIYEDPELTSPSEIIERNGSKCPRCSSTLKFDPSSLTISVRGASKKGLLKIFQK